MNTIQHIRSMSPTTRRRWLDSLTVDELVALQYYWPLHARPEQCAPDGDWSIWLLLAGRGFGKTRSGAEYVLERIQNRESMRTALVARTAADVRDVIVEGPSGILARSHPSWRPRYEPSKRRLTWPHGAVATTFSADEPDLLRGPEHDTAWCDELAAWRYEETWSNLRFGLRTGRPRTVVTTTPRPTPLLRRLLKMGSTVVTRGSTYDNRANLAPEFFAEIIGAYEGTRLGRQELNAELLDDTEGALWTGDMIEQQRVSLAPAPEQVARSVLAIDPAVSAEEGSSETGMVAACRTHDGHLYILADYSGRMSPLDWARRASYAYKTLDCDRVVAEVNQGGDLVEANLRNICPDIPYMAVRAKVGKRLRAEPVAALYERGLVHHVGCFAELEDQMTGWLPGAASPDRLDALVYALTDLSDTRVYSGAAPVLSTRKSPHALFR